MQAHVCNKPVTENMSVAYPQTTLLITAFSVICSNYILLLGDPPHGMERNTKILINQ